MQVQTNQPPRRAPLPDGIELRHSRSCPGGACKCDSYRASVYNARTRKKERKTFSGKGALTAAKRWRAAAMTDVADGKRIAPSKTTLRDAAEAWLEGAKAEPP